MDTNRLKPTLWHLAVLIPARNEAALLPRCLASIAAARALLPQHVSTDVVVVADCCTDGTEQLAQTCLQGRGAVVSADAGCVGVARSLAAEVAVGRYKGRPDRCWLANTDADCEVPPTWLLQQLHLAQKGYTAVAGIVDVDDFSEHLAVVRERFRLSYTLHADGTHPHVHGANLGVRADVYERAGGWNPLATAEDHDLWGRLCALEGMQRSDSSLQVMTSGRRVGRAPLGFAGALAAHNAVLSAI